MLNDKLSIKALAQYNLEVGHNRTGAGDALGNPNWTPLDAVEAFASYRRTGYPALVPNNYPDNATGGKIFRRMLYPIT